LIAAGVMLKNSGRGKFDQVKCGQAMCERFTGAAGRMSTGCSGGSGLTWGIEGTSAWGTTFVLPGLGSSGAVPGRPGTGFAGICGMPSGGMGVGITGFDGAGIGWIGVGIIGLGMIGPGWIGEGCGCAGVWTGPAAWTGRFNPASRLNQVKNSLGRRFIFSYRFQLGCAGRLQQAPAPAFDFKLRARPVARHGV